MDDLIEVWRTVPSLPQIEASSFGRIRRIEHTKPMPHGGQRVYRSLPTFGYRVPSTGLAGFRMIIRIASLKKTFKVARLVCEAFHGLAPEGKKLAMHLDDDPGNNKPGNLIWGSSKQNLNTPQFISYCQSRTGANHPRAKGLRA